MKERRGGYHDRDNRKGGQYNDRQGDRRGGDNKQGGTYMTKSKTAGQMQYQEKKTYNSGEPGMQKTKSYRDDKDRKNDRGGKRDD